MGNAILRCFKGGHEHDDYYYTPSSSAPPYRPSVPSSSRPQYQYQYQTQEVDVTAGFVNLSIHLLNFETNSRVPAGLSQHVTASKKTQAEWYAKILAAWNKSPPTTAEEAASLVARALQFQREALAGFLQFYGLPIPEVHTDHVSDPSSWPEGVQFELHTLPVQEQLVGDGDGMTVHVSTTDPRESADVPLEVQEAAMQRREALAVRDYVRADALDKIITKAKYRVVTGDILAREYRIRLRGIDAPEMNQAYGPEAKDALRKLIRGKPLKILVYCKDPYDRLVGDVHCNGIFIQEKLLRKGCAWHYKAFDKRPAFAQWQKEARNAGKGLWANPNAIAPWVFKRSGRNNAKRPYHNKRNAQRDQRVPIPAY